MSLTQGPLGAAWPPMQRVAERIELMALLWQVIDGDTAYCANPRLLMVGRLLPELQTLNPTIGLRHLRATMGRDAVIKDLVRSSHGQTVAAEIEGLAAALDHLSSQWDDLLGHLAPPLTKAYHGMRERADPLAARLDPAADLGALVGEYAALDVRVLPSLFLPPPQNGRHSVLVETLGQDPIAYLHYGFPLDDDPGQFGISRYWLLGGAWHYAVDRFLRRHWPAISLKLCEMPDLEKRLVAALVDHRAAVEWPRIVAEHVGIALKCGLCARAGMPETVHRHFARAQGLAFFDWFRNWMEELGRDPAKFVARLHELPQDLERQQDMIVAVAGAHDSGPVSINFALASRERIPSIVLPDHWSEVLAAHIRSRWSAVSNRVLRESEWRASPPEASSTILFGQFGRDRIVDDMLIRRGLALEKSAEGGELLVALFPSEQARGPWQIAVAVCDPEVAGGFAAEHLMKLFHRTARFRGYRFVEGDGLPETDAVLVH